MRRTIPNLAANDGIFRVWMPLSQGSNFLLGLLITREGLAPASAIRISDNQPPWVFTLLYEKESGWLTFLIQFQGLAPQGKTSFAFLLF